MVRFFSLFLTLVFLAGCGGEQTSPRDSAERFFALLKAGKIADAYDSASASFRIAQSRKYFEARVLDLGLHEFKSLVLGKPDERSGMTRVQGDFKLKDDSTLVLTLGFVKEAGNWKLAEARRAEAEGAIGENVFAVKARSSDTVDERSKAFLEPIATALPTDRQIEQLARRSLLDFNDAVKAGDFTDFYESVSDRWKYRGKDLGTLNYTGSENEDLQKSDPFNKAGRLTKEALHQTYRPFVDAKVDLGPIAKASMKLDEPARVTSDGVLIAKGKFDCIVFLGTPPKPGRMDFLLEYVFESSRWKLFGITVTVLQTDPKDTPGK